MARLINEDELIKNRVDDYLDKSTSQFTKFLETTPNFVTYYQYDTVNSTLDKGLEGVEKHIGSHSPNKFNRIEKFPIYGIDTMSLSQELEETGMKTTYEGDAIVLPNTIRPYPGDCFSFDSLSDLYLFRINGVTNDTIRNKPFYRVSFSLYRKLPDENYMDEFVTDELVSIFSNIGGRSESIITKSDYMIADQIDQISEELIKRYTRNFYFKNLNVIALKCYCGTYLFNRYLTKFIMDNELFKIEKGFRTDYYLTDINDGQACMFQNYRKTIYYALEKRTTKMGIKEFGILHDYKNFKVNQFTTWGKPYLGLRFTETEGEDTMRLFPHDFIKNINEGKLYTDTPEYGDLSTEYLEFIYDSNNNPIHVKQFLGTDERLFIKSERSYLEEELVEVEGTQDENEKIYVYEEVGDPFDPNEWPMGENVIVENIIIKYMNGTLKLTEEDLDALMDIDFDYDMYCYSMVPLILFVLKQYRKKLTATIK